MSFSGSIAPITSCDSECALVNGCQVGSIQCRKCGNYFCQIELKDGLCPDCSEEESEDDAQALRYGSICT